MSKHIKLRKTKQTDEKIWYTLEEGAAYLSVTKATLYNYMNEGLLPFYELSVGRGRRLRREDLDGLLTRRVGGSTRAADGSKDD